MSDVAVSPSRSEDLIPILDVDHPPEPAAPHGRAAVALLNDGEQIRRRSDRTKTKSSFAAGLKEHLTFYCCEG